MLGALQSSPSGIPNHTIHVKLKKGKGDLHFLEQKEKVDIKQSPAKNRRQDESMARKKNSRPSLSGNDGRI